MADQTISQLNQLSSAVLAAGDELPIVDISASETKKIRAVDLIQSGIALTASGNIDLGKLNQNSATKLNTIAFANGSITAAKLAGDSSIAEQSTAPTVDNFAGRGWYRTTDGNFFVYSAGNYQQVVMPTAGIANGAITTAKIAAQAVTDATIQTGGLTAASIASNAVTTVKILDGNVTTGKVADSAITGAKIAAASVDATKLAAGSVGTAALANGGIVATKFAAGAVDTNALGALAVTNDKIANATVAYAKLNLADGSVPGSKITSATIGAAQLAAAAVNTAALADSSVTSSKIATSGVTPGKIGADAVTTVTVASAAITGAKLAAEAVGTAALATSGITSAKFAAGAVGNVALGAGAVTNDKIADATIAYGKLNLADGSVPGTKITSATVSGLQLATAAVNTAALADGSVTSSKIATSAVTPGKIGTDAVTTVTIASAAVTGAKLAAESVGTAALATSGITSAKFAAGAVDTVALGAGAVTNDKITDGTIAYGKLNLADGSVPGTKITSATISGLQLAAGGVLAANLADEAVTNAKIASATIGAGKYAASSIATADIADDAITTDKIADAAVTSAQIAANEVEGSNLADDSSVVVESNSPSGNGQFIGQQWLDTSTGYEYTWDGSQWQRQSAINDISFVDSTPLNFAVTYPDNFSAVVTTTLDNQTASTIFAGPASGAASAPSFRALAPTDLPIATAGTVGGVFPGAGLAVQTNGEIGHSNTAAAGTYAGPVTIDAQGHIVSAQAALQATDIPDLDASKIITGTFSSEFLADNSVTAAQLADYGIAQVSESAPTPEFAGQWWINPNDRSAYIWVGEVTPVPNGYWLNLGYGSPTQINLRFGGTYNASGNVVESINSYGIEAGLTIGQQLSSPNTSNNGVYLIVTSSGVGTTPAPTDNLAIGNWVLSQGVGANWTRVNLSSAVAGVGDQDVLVDGGALIPVASGVATQENFNVLTWGRVQIATASTAGIVRASSTITVASGTGIMNVGIVDDGSY
jgi:hypothetical protein